MKKFNELTVDEILALTDEQIEKIIKYRKAEEGIKLLEKPTEPEYEEEMKKDISIYSLKWLEHLVFYNIEDAELLSKSIKNNLKNWFYKNYNWSIKSVNTLDSYDRDRFSFVVLEELHFSPEKAEQAKQIEKRNEELRNKYNKLLNEYNAYIEDIQWLIDEVWNKIFEVRRKNQEILRLKNCYSEYLVLANWDEEIATNFLKKAEKVTEEDLILIK